MAAEPMSVSDKVTNEHDDRSGVADSRPAEGAVHWSGVARRPILACVSWSV